MSIRLVMPALRSLFAGLIVLSGSSAFAAPEGEYRLGVNPNRNVPAQQMPQMQQQQMQQQQMQQQPLQQQQAVGSAPDIDYRLAGGDEIKISVFQNADLATQTRLSESGLISFPLVGSVKVGGLTLNQAESEIARRLKTGGFVIDAQVSITLSAIVGNQVSVLGQVNKPGTYPLLNAGYKLSQILATAGGISQTGGDMVVLSGVRDGRPFRTEIDVEDLYAPNRGPAQGDIALAAGDSIYVPRAQQFFIYGQVQRPGSYVLARNMTVMQALAQGGGLTLRGTERSLRLYRRQPNGQMKEMKPKMTDLVKQDDVLNIGESLF